MLYTTSLDGHELLAAALKPTTKAIIALGPFQATLRNKYGRLRTVAAAADGALWLTTSNKDGQGHPVADVERVLRITPTGGNGGDSPT